MLFSVTGADAVWMAEKVVALTSSTIIRDQLRERTTLMDYQDRHVVVTGGTGALGTAVVGALLEAGATCHVPYRSDREAKHFAYANNRKSIADPSARSRR